jgi:hypothetical protein
VEEFLEVSGFTREEWREISRIMLESEPHYAKMAPETLEEMHRSQERDLEWTDMVEHEAMETMSLPEARGTKLEMVDCRETLCLISYTHESEASYHDYENSPMDQGPWISGASNSFGGMVPQEDGSVESFRYFTKKDSGETFLEMRKQIIQKVRQKQGGLTD